ncbi:NAD(+) diphosphatase [Roseovarius sp. SYSU LYC5161]|uniref:NAD(+) diphosphatase n=1 Tax=Roseovarius halophilus (ex Wu et al. 2025) TaxID=3376060 RepID=UPI002871435E|nr:NAD(+) diphosphatase [Roseovarius sp.]
MQRAESVTFGGSGLDRAADLRGDAQAQQMRIDEGLAATIVLWRGKPMVAGSQRDSLALLPMDHPLLAGPALPRILLGREASGRLIYAHDISGWQPDGVDPACLDGFSDETEQRHPLAPRNCVFAELRRIMARLSPRDAELAATARAVAGWHVSHRFCARCGGESRLVLDGWQRRCDACGGQHFPRTDPVVIMLVTWGNSVLVGRSPGWPEGMYSLLAGFVEPGETIEAAVRREVREETAIEVGAVTYLASQPWAFPASLMFGCRGEALNRDISIDPAEIEDAMWITREDMLTAHAGEHPFLKPAREGAIAHFLLRNWLADTLD